MRQFVGGRQRRGPGRVDLDEQIELRVAVNTHQCRVAERVAQRGQFPVERRANAGGVFGIQDGVVDAVVA